MQLRAPCWVPPESRAMDFDLNDHQRRRLEAVGSLIDKSGAAADAEKLDEALLASDFHRGATVLERFLIAEALARRGVGCGYGLYCLLSDLLPTDLPAGLVAITEANRSGPVRFADTAAVVVQLHAEQATIHAPRRDEVRPANTTSGYHYAHVSLAGQSRALPDGAGVALRTRWRLALIAEISGNARSAIGRTAEHLRSREQFGQPLASFQALRHRLADAAVSAEATTWMGREAAFNHDPRSILRAAWYASDTAAKLVPELVQMCGARAFTIEFGLHTYTMRMNCLRLELGGIDRLGQELAANDTIQRIGAGVAR
jgi:Acyl-CoA dehydrogenase, C-terminal domain